MQHFDTPEELVAQWRHRRSYWSAGYGDNAQAHGKFEAYDATNGWLPQFLRDRDRELGRLLRALRKQVAKERDEVSDSWDKEYDHATVVELETMIAELDVVEARAGIR